MANVLSAEKICSGYGKSLVVDNVTVKVEERQVVGIIGANGSGKSTLLKTVVGLIKPFSGKIVYDGKDISNWQVDKINRSGVGYVPQIQNTFPNLSVRENFRMGGYYLSKSDVATKTREMLAIFPELGNYLNTTVESLSGRARQMVAFARPLMISPKLLLLDEPTAALAPVVVNKMMEKISAIKESGVAVLMVEQNARKALSISDYVYVMLSGRVIAEGKADVISGDKDLGKMLLGVR